MTWAISFSLLWSAVSLFGRRGIPEKIFGTYLISKRCLSEIIHGVQGSDVVGIEETSHMGGGVETWVNLGFLNV
jgi:hypothetical protein